MKKGPFKMRMKQYGQGKNPIMRKDVTGDGVYTKKDLLVERGVPGFEKGMDNKKSPAELGRLKSAFGGALSKLGLGRRKSSGSGGAIGSLAGAKLMTKLGGKLRPMAGGLGIGSGGAAIAKGLLAARPVGNKNTVGQVARGAANLFKRFRSR
jgi:hypothetical protein